MSGIDEDEIAHATPADRLPEEATPFAFVPHDAARYAPHQQFATRFGTRHRSARWRRESKPATRPVISSQIVPGSVLTAADCSAALQTFGMGQFPPPTFFRPGGDPNTLTFTILSLPNEPRFTCFLTSAGVNLVGPVRQEGDRSCPQPVGDSGCPFGENPHGGEGISQRQICDPIVFDFGDLGIDLTDADDGVAFDIDADGAADQVAWTSARSRDAFLTLDRNGNGAVDDGGELFGNATRLVDGTFASDGYVVLAELDQPENGGNGNGFIDRADRIYAELRLWTDSNHDGVSAPSELTSLETRAVVAIRTAARRSAATDEHGNRFALVSVAYVKTFGVVRPILTTDVFLVEAD